MEISHEVEVKRSNITVVSVTRMLLVCPLL